MLRTTLDKAYLKRTIRPLYGLGQQVGPKDCVLDSAWNRAVDIYPGMVVMSKGTSATAGTDVVGLIDATGLPYGLIGVYIAPVLGIDEVRDQGISAVPVWMLDGNAEYEILAPAFDTDETWTFPTDGTALLVHAQTAGADRGKLVPSGVGGASAKPIARALSRPATDRLIITGLGLPGAY